jgi:hypothetical protein
VSWNFKAHRQPPPEWFDAVALMRSARDRASEEIEAMTLEEALKWLAAPDLQDPS